MFEMINYAMKELMPSKGKKEDKGQKEKLS